jgi:hypothetical protein
VYFKITGAQFYSRYQEKNLYFFLFTGQNRTKYVFPDYFHLYPQHILQQGTQTELNSEGAEAEWQPE